MIKKTFTVISVIYWSIAIFLIGIFILYAIYTVEYNKYYVSSNLSQEQSEDIKELIGFSQFTSLNIINYSHRLVYGDDAIRHYVFEISISENEHPTFIEYINKHMSEIHIYIKPRVEIYKNDFISDKSIYEMQIDYIGQEGAEGPIRTYVYYDDHDIQYSNKVWLLIPRFMLLILLFIVTYSIIKKISYKKQLTDEVI